jgi:membrane-associated protease RseP (regulator of RpoE activity)
MMRSVVRWRPLAACGLAAAVLAGGVGVAARGEGDKPAPKKEEKAKKEPAAQPGAAKDSLEQRLRAQEEEFRAMQARIDAAQKRMEKAMRELQQRAGLPGMPLGGFPAMPAMPAMPGGIGGFPPLVVPGFGGFGGPARQPAGGQEPRLGVQVRKPSATLEDQLDLPKGQGLVLEEVGPNSAAAKAGLKPHDILLELNGKAVPSKREEFAKLLRGVKANAAVDVVVMRKGRKETIKGLSLPEAKVTAAAPAPGANAFAGGGPGLVLGFNNVGGGGSTSISRSNDAFSASNSTGGVSVKVKGKVEGGKPQVSEVTVTANGTTKTYASLDKVPAEYRERAKKLAEAAAGNGAIRFGFPPRGN